MELPVTRHLIISLALALLIGVGTVFSGIQSSAMEMAMLMSPEKSVDHADPCSACDRDDGERSTSNCHVLCLSVGQILLVQPITAFDRITTNVSLSIAVPSMSGLAHPPDLTPPKLPILV
jgi:hypothetical protein